ncbi:MAG: MFS transporter [Promethearchaeota archaeon]
MSMERQGNVVEEKLPIITKVAYGVAYIGNSSLSQLALGGAVSFFYSTKMGLESNWIALAWLIFSFWNAINDPLIGIIQDKTKSRWGRRVPYLRFGAPFYSLAFIMMWFPFGSASQQGLLFTSFLINLFIFDTLYSMIGLITYGLAAEMCVTTKCRSNLIIWGSLLGAVGSIVALVIPMILLTETGVHPAFRPTMIGLAGFSMICLIWSSFYIKENKYTQREETLSFIKSITESFRNKPFLVFEGAVFLLTIAQTILFTGLYYFINYILVLKGIMASLPLASIYIVSLFALFIWNYINRKIGLKKSFIISLGIGAVAGILSFFAGQNFWFSLITLSIFGFGISGSGLFTGQINADCIDYDELRTAKRRETSYSGVNALITKPAISIANAVFFYIIEAFGFPHSIESIPNYVATESVKTGILIGFTLIPAIMFVGAMLIMIFYPLDGSDWDNKKKLVQEIHLKKEEEYLEFLKNEHVKKSSEG